MRQGAPSMLRAEMRRCLSLALAALAGGLAAVNVALAQEAPSVLPGNEIAAEESAPPAEAESSPVAEETLANDNTLTDAPAPRPAPPEAIAAVEAHFAAILAQDYHGASEWFSASFLRAFKAEVARTNEYYLTRGVQLAPGYQVVEALLLDDPGIEAARVTVDFNPEDSLAPVLVTERMHYYLVREKGIDGSPGRDASGRAWRIDIYDAFEHNSLADARRRAYLYTREAWPEDGSRQLRSQQGLFRIQWALDAYAVDRGYYPEKLIGGDNKKDALINGKYLTGAYPPCGWGERPMGAVGANERSSGDFTYLPVDNDKDGNAESYWLLLHGKVAQAYYFNGLDIVYILGSSTTIGQYELALEFAEHQLALGSPPLEHGPGLLALAPVSVPLVSTQAASGTVAEGTLPQTLLAGLSELAARQGHRAFMAMKHLPLLARGRVVGAAQQQEGDVAESHPFSFSSLPHLRVWSFGFD